MTEDETFRILSRGTFEDVVNEYWRVSPGLTLSEVLTKHKWTLDEFFTEKARRDLNYAEHN